MSGGNCFWWLERPGCTIKTICSLSVLGDFPSKPFEGVEQIMALKVGGPFQIFPASFCSLFGSGQVMRGNVRVVMQTVRMRFPHTFPNIVHLIE